MTKLKYIKVYKVYIVKVYKITKVLKIQEIYIKKKIKRIFDITKYFFLFI